MACSLMRPLGDVSPEPTWRRISTVASLEEALPLLLAVGESPRGLQCRR